MERHLESTILGDVEAESLVVGRGVVVEEGVCIRGLQGPAREVVLGDFCFIGRGTRILVPEFRLGDYSKLHAGSFGHGVHPLRIGRNCWIGGNVVLDSMGGLDIEDNVGVGSQSQLWSHIRFGDVVEGSRFNAARYLHVAEDAWFVGHCIVSPVRVERRSMALVGSVVTRDMLENRVYAGVPAEDVTEKVGPQFEDRTLGQKMAAARRLIDEFELRHPEHRGRVAVLDEAESIQPGVTYLNMERRSYQRTYSPAEVTFLKSVTPLMKLTAEGDPPFVVPQEPDPD